MGRRRGGAQTCHAGLPSKLVGCRAVCCVGAWVTLAWAVPAIRYIASSARAPRIAPLNRVPSPPRRDSRPEARPSGSHPYLVCDGTGVAGEASHGVNEPMLQARVRWRAACGRGRSLLSQGRDRRRSWLRLGRKGSGRLVNTFVVGYDFVFAADCKARSARRFLFPAAGVAGR